MYAPVAVFCYNRKDHLEQTLKALENNSLAEASEVYIFSDGFRGEKDRAAVGEVREFLHGYIENARFKKVHLTEAAENKGLADSIIGGASNVLEQYGKIIVLEDDMVTSEDFLEFMNQALDYYEKDETIWSVSGYTLPLKILKKYRADVYLSYRAGCWTWATWKDRWDTVDWSVSDFNELCQNKRMQDMLNRGGREMFQMLKDQQEGKNNSWAIRWCYSQSRQDKYSVHPKYCKVRNIGIDGSGENSLATKKYRTEIDPTPIRLTNVAPDKKLLKQFRDFYRLTLEEIWLLGIAKIKKDFHHLFFRKK